MVSIREVGPRDGFQNEPETIATDDKVRLVEMLARTGLRRLEVDKGVAGGAPGAPAPFACVGHLYFDSVADFQAAMKPHGKELFADVPNFTDITPQMQISEIIHS